MIRPSSIVNFERCYLGALLLSYVNAAIGWRDQTELATMSAAQSGMATGGVQAIMLGTMAFTTLVTLLLWFFAARRRSNVARWIIVVLFALGAVGLTLGIARGTMPTGLAGILTIITWVLNAVAVVLLFRPDARDWFDRANAATPEDLADRFS